MQPKIALHYYCFGIPSLSGKSREILKRLKPNGMTQILHAAFGPFLKPTNIPNTLTAVRSTLLIPFYNHIVTNNQNNFV